MYLVTYTRKHPGVYKRMRFTYIPEEIYVPTVIMNSPYRNNIIWKNNCHTILWKHEGIDYSPINICKSDLRRLLSNPIGFFGSGAEVRGLTPRTSAPEPLYKQKKKMSQPLKNNSTAE